VGKLSAEDLARAREYAERIEGNGKCPDHACCSGYSGSCDFTTGCQPIAKKDDPESNLYVWVFYQLSTGQRIEYDSTIFIDRKNRFISSGGNEKRVSSIIEDAAESYYRRKSMNKSEKN
jgi:hypothetical protein